MSAPISIARQVEAVSAAADRLAGRAIGRRSATEEAADVAALEQARMTLQWCDRHAAALAAAREALARQRPLASIGQQIAAVTDALAAQRVAVETGRQPRRRELREAELEYLLNRISAALQTLIFCRDERGAIARALKVKSNGEAA